MSIPQALVEAMAKQKNNNKISNHILQYMILNGYGKRLMVKRIYCTQNNFAGKLFMFLILVGHATWLFLVGLIISRKQILVCLICV